MYMLKPNAAAPDLVVDTLEHGRWTLAERRPELFTLIVFYRGYFCGSCQEYLGQLHALLGDFAELGVDVIAISMDEREQAEAARTDWGVDGLTIGYGLTLAEAETWDLYTADRRDAHGRERLFNQPGLFLVRPDRTLYAAFVQSSEFARPNLEQVRQAVAYQA